LSSCVQGQIDATPEAFLASTFVPGSLAVADENDVDHVT
jgi:hypothetical protein